MTALEGADASAAAGSRPWDEVVPRSEREVYEAAGFGARTPWGRRPSVLVVDVNRDFVGDRREPLLSVIAQYPFSCGEAAWDSMPHIAALLAKARTARVPVCYTTAAVVESPGPWGNKHRPPSARGLAERRRGAEIASLVTPQPGELVLAKAAPSGFFGTALHAELAKAGVDTVIVAGCVTSGCVRATVVDAFSYGYRVVVPEECCFDRARVPHLVNLYDIDQKYGDVVSLQTVLRYIDALT